MNTTDIPVLIGGGGHARSLVAMAPATGRPRCCVDNAPCTNLEWLGNDDDFLADSRYADTPVMVAYVAPASCSMVTRRSIIEKYSGRRFATIIAADAIVCPDVVVGAGSMVFHRAVVNTGSYLGCHNIVNTGAIVEHDVTTGDNVFIGPGAVVAGGVSIGNDVYIGAGACIRNGITIADGVTIGMGAVVVKPITVAGTYVGNPARPL